MLKEILVPTDGSDFSRQVVPMVLAIVKAQGAEVACAYVVDAAATVAMQTDDSSPGLTMDLMETMEAEGRESLTWLAKEFEGEGIPVRTALLHGTVSATLLAYASEVEADLVIMATHARAGLARLVFGSTADRIVLEGSAPVLLLGPSAPVPASVTRALVPLDGSPLAEEALLTIESLAGRPLRAVTLMRAVGAERERDEAADYLRGVAQPLSAGGLEVSTEVRTGAPVAAIEEAARDVDLVLMATHGRGGLDRLRHGSVAQAAEQRLTKPLLLTRPRLAKAAGDVAQFLASVRLFAHVRADLLRKLATFAEARSYGRGEVIVREGDLGVGLFVLRSGRAEATSGPNGEEKRLRAMGPGEVFGEIAALGESIRTATVRAMEPTSCLVINGVTLRSVLEESPDTMEQVRSLIAERLGVGTPGSGAAV